MLLFCACLTQVLIQLTHINYGCLRQLDLFLAAARSTTPPKPTVVSAINFAYVICFYELQGTRWSFFLSYLTYSMVFCSSRHISCELLGVYSTALPISKYKRDKVRNKQVSRQALHNTAKDIICFIFYRSLSRALQRRLLEIRTAILTRFPQRGLLVNQWPDALLESLAKTGH